MEIRIPPLGYGAQTPNRAAEAERGEDDNRHDDEGVLILD